MDQIWRKWSKFIFEWNTICQQKQQYAAKIPNRRRLSTQKRSTNIGHDFILIRTLQRGIESFKNSENKLLGGLPWANVDEKGRNRIRGNVNNGGCWGNNDIIENTFLLLCLITMNIYLFYYKTISSLLQKYILFVNFKVLLIFLVFTVSSLHHWRPNAVVLRKFRVPRKDKLKLRTSVNWLI